LTASLSLFILLCGALFVSFLTAVNVLCVWVLIGLCGIVTAIAQSSISESNRAWISLHITWCRGQNDRFTVQCSSCSHQDKLELSIKPHWCHYCLINAKLKLFWKDIPNSAAFHMETGFDWYFRKKMILLSIKFCALFN
jgi:hypothetical protein